MRMYNSHGDLLSEHVLEIAVPHGGAPRNAPYDRWPDGMTA